MILQRRSYNRVTTCEVIQCFINTTICELSVVPIVNCAGNGLSQYETAHTGGLDPRMSIKQRTRFSKFRSFGWQTAKSVYKVFHFAVLASSGCFVSDSPYGTSQCVTIQHTAMTWSVSDWILQIKSYKKCSKTHRSFVSHAIQQHLREIWRVD